jgi:hypothetical protein
MLWIGGAVLATAVIAVAFVTRRDRAPQPATVAVTSPRTTTQAGTDEPRAADDPSLALVTDLAADLDWDEAREAGLTTHVGSDDDAVMLLSDPERRELQELLKREMARSPA